MKNYFKYSMLITIVLLITTSLVHVQAVAPAIGTTTQPHPYESNPSTEAYFGVGDPVLPGDARDGDLSTNGRFALGSAVITRPMGDVAGFAQWTLVGTGLTKHYEAVDDAPGHDTDGTYIKVTSLSAGVAKEDIFDLNDVAGSVGSIASVTVKAVVKKVSGTPTFKLIVRVAGTRYYGTAETTTSGYTTVYETWTGNPGNSNNPWTWSNIDALQAGVQAYSASAIPCDIRVTQLYVEILGDSGYYEISGFANYPATTFTIGFVDLKMDYKVPSNLTDDRYNVTYTIGTGNPWITLQPNVTGGVDWTRFDKSGSEVVRPWSQVARPGGGSWIWDDIGSLRIKVSVTRRGAAWDGISMYTFEVWASVYPLPLPPSGGTPAAHLAVIPSAIYKVEAAQYIFVDIYVTGVSAMGGIDFTMLFDTSILTATDAWIYDPFQYVNTAPLTLDNTNGWVIFAQYMPTGEGVGFTGSEPIARIYFTVNQWGMSKLNIQNATESGPKATAMYTVTGPSIPYVDHDGWVSAPRYLSAVDASNNPTTIDLAHPNNTRWHELWPHYSSRFNITSWEDTDSSGDLSYCDQIDMLNETRYKHWFHVDVVTITIHWSNTTPTMEGIAEPSPPAATLPTDPTGTPWTEIYSTFNRPMTIDNYTDVNTNTIFDIGDIFGATYTDTPTSFYATLDHVSTDILVSMKPMPPVYVPPAVPEFPLGIEILMAITPMIPIIYLWRKRPKKRV